jgi:hypothetical protein
MDPVPEYRSIRPSGDMTQSPGGRIIGGVFGFVFFGIGLTVIGFLWGAGFDEFGSPPIFFRIFGSLISLAFVTIGGLTLVSAVLGRNLLGSPRRPLKGEEPASAAMRPATSTGRYECPHCAAGLADGAEVSPLGDVKCAYCDRWFNIHREEGV